MPTTPTMHVQIKLKPPPRRKHKSNIKTGNEPRILRSEQPAPSYEEALMMPELGAKTTGSSEGAKLENDDNDDNDNSYSVDAESFESYSVENDERDDLQVTEEDLGVDEHNHNGASDQHDHDSEGECDNESNDEERGEFAGSVYVSLRSPRAPLTQTAKSRPKTMESKTEPKYCYDGSTYAIITTLRAQNKRLVAQLEQQCKLIDTLNEEKKQHQHTIQTLRADTVMYKQTIKTFQSTGVRDNRLSLGNRSQLESSSRPATSSGFSGSTILPVMIKHTEDRPMSPRLAARCVTPTSLSTAEVPSKSAGSPRFASPPCSPSTNRRLIRSTEREQIATTKEGTGDPRRQLEKYAIKLERAEQEHKELVARHTHQLANFSHELSRLERQLEHAQRAVQEKDNALRLQRTRQLYPSPNNSTSNNPSGFGVTNTNSAMSVGTGKRRDSFISRNSIFSDDIWRELLPVPPEKAHARLLESFSSSSANSGANTPEAAALGFSSHVGRAFEELVAHPLVALHDLSLDTSAREWLFELRSCGKQMLELHAAVQTLGRSLKALAESNSTYQLVDALTSESRSLLMAEQALVFVADKAEQEFWCRVPRTANTSSTSQMVTVRSKLLPFGSTPPSNIVLENQGKSSWTTPCGLASMVFHTKRPLLLAAGQMSKHACFSPSSNDSSDRLIEHPSASTLLIPVIHDGHTLAVVQAVGKTAHVEALGLSIALEKHDSFTLEDQSLLALLCQFASGLLPKVAYFTEVESNKVNEETLIQLAPEIFTCLRFDELGKIVIENAKDILDADRCSLFVADNAERTLYNWQSDISGAGVQVLDASKKSAMSIPFGHGIVGLVAETWQPINIVDAYDDPRFNSTWDKKTNYRTKSMLTVPILSNAIKKQPLKRNGEDEAGAKTSVHGEHRPPSQTPVSQQQHMEQTLLGVVQVINKSGGAPFRSKDEFLLQTITKLIALAIENSQLFQKNQALCWDVGRLIADGDLVEALINLGVSAEEIIGVESACIYVVDEANRELVTFHRKRRYRIAIKEDAYRDSLFEDAVRSKELLIINDVASAPHFNAYVDSIGGIPARNVLFAPLLIDDPDATSIGALSLQSDAIPTPTNPNNGKKLVGLMHLVNTKGRKLHFDRHDLFLSIVQSQSCSVVASILEKQEMLREKAQVTRLLDTSMSFFKEMSPVGIINAVYNSCTSIFNVEKAHLFLWETDRRHMWTSKLAPNAAGAVSSVSTGVTGGDSDTSGGQDGGTHRRRQTNQPLSFIPTLSAQARRISVLTDQRLRAPTTEGLLEKVLVHGTAVIVREWIDDPNEEHDRGGKDGEEGETRKAPLPKRTTGRHVMQAAGSDERLGFTKHSVLACPVWDHYGLEVVGILVLLFKKGHVVQHSEELANLPILSRQIAGALNVCGDVSLVSTRCRQLQSMLELSKKKPEDAVSLTLSARGYLVSFSQPINVATLGFNVFALKAAMYHTQALNLGVHVLPMDEEGHRRGFQLSSAPIQDVLGEHYMRWIGKGVDGAFDKLLTDLQGVYQRKEVLSGLVSYQEDNESHTNTYCSLPKDVVVPLRQLLWEFTDAQWRVDAGLAASRLFGDAIERSGSSGHQLLVNRRQLELALSDRVQLEQMQWDLLHARFADASTDLVDVEAMLEALRPRVERIRSFRYELVPVLDPVTQTVVGVHALLRSQDP